MTNVFDAAVYILKTHGPMTAMKLHKLLFYGQAWSLVWDDTPLFHNRIEAWANGPVVPALYKAHKGLYRVDRNTFPTGDCRNLSKSAKDTIMAILTFYGKKSSHYLSALTHAEKPWKDARGTLGPSERGNVEITHAAMAEYYGSLI